MNYQYRDVQIWGESTYEKYGVMNLLHSIDTKHHSKADIPASPIANGIDNIHIYCLSDSPLLGLAKHINEIREKHCINDKIVILLPAVLRRVSIDYMESVNISVIPYARTLFRMGLLLKAALYTDRYKITKKI
ncbi:Uncharacterised protein [Edwardsiella tarda]|nr:Uncharacterised protein [Edwardsiella tarda]